jgi:hypothetical protein
MTIEELGKEGEEKARVMLSKLGFLLTKPDWLGERDGAFYQFEIKMKSEPFTPPPFFGHGLDIDQIRRRLSLQDKHNLPCVVIIFEKDSPNVYYQCSNKHNT